MVEFTHIQNERAQMVDISAKNDVIREAVAAGKIFLKPETMKAIREGTVVKGNVLSTARVAATLSVKNTPSLIPMCHPIPISAITVDFFEGEGFIESTVRREIHRKDRCRDGGACRGFNCVAYGLGYGEVSRKRCSRSVSGYVYSGYPGH